MVARSLGNPLGSVRGRTEWLGTADRVAGLSRRDQLPCRLNHMVRPVARDRPSVDRTELWVRFGRLVASRSMVRKILL